MIHLLSFTPKSSRFFGTSSKGDFRLIRLKRFLAAIVPFRGLGVEILIFNENSKSEC